MQMSSQRSAGRSGIALARITPLGAMATAMIAAGTWSPWMNERA